MDKLKLTVFRNRKAPLGRVREYSWEALVEKLSSPVMTDETMEEYAAMTNEQRTDIKDVGGYIGGECENGRRSKSTILSRSILTIDADNASRTAIEDYEREHDAVYFCHSTHSSTEEFPRLRWLFPLSRPVTSDEYRLLVSIVKHWVGEETIDESTDQPERLMFWPSVGLETHWVAQEGGLDVIDPDVLLDGIEMPEPVRQSKPTDEEKDDSDFTIWKGGRDNALTSQAGSLREMGWTEDMIRRGLDIANELCDVPKDDRSLDRIAHSVCRYKRGSPVPNYLRTARDDFYDLGEWKDSPEKPSALQMESFASLCARDVRAPKFIVDGLITTGITILASPPKFGKSWMSLDMCLSVATGTEFMGMKTTKTGVLYLALEDGDYRLKERGLKVTGGRQIPENLFLVKKAPILEEGLLKDLQKIIGEHDTRIGLIVIDTLQKIRGTAKKNEGVYGYDYRELGDLHQFALDQDIAVILVHHLNKGKDDGTDNVARINGSTGVSGAADTIITLTRTRRTDSETRMEITGRDVRSRTLVIMFDDLAHRWIYLGREDEVEQNRDRLEFDNDPVVKTLVRAMDAAEELVDENADEVVWRIASKQLLDKIDEYTGQAPDTTAKLGRQLRSMSRKLQEYEQITFSMQHKMSGNEYTFTRPVAT